MELQFLTCPQLMSDDVLRDILKDVGIFEVMSERCIELPGIKSMDKIELIEIFKRVALPLPQRIYNEERLLGKKLQSLRLSRNISVVNYNENVNSNTGTTGVSDNNTKSSESSMRSHSNRLKSPINDSKILEKRIRLSSTDKAEAHVDDSHDIKRKSEVSPQTDSKKRQKITWP